MEESVDAIEEVERDSHIDDCEENGRAKAQHCCEESRGVSGRLETGEEQG